jgi:hypothetical protein
MGAILELMFYVGILCIPFCIVGYFIERKESNENRTRN